MKLNTVKELIRNQINNIKEVKRFNYIPIIDFVIINIQDLIWFQMEKDI